MMNWKEIDGDLVSLWKKGDVDWLVHCCNAQGVMGSGIALQVAQQIPEAFTAYRRFHENTLDFDILGVANIVDLCFRKDNLHGVVNLIGQRSYGSGERFVSYDAIETSLREFRTYLEKHAAATPIIGIPYKMGSDRAGGDWAVIEAIIKSVFSTFDCTIVIVKYSG